TVTATVIVRSEPDSVAITSNGNYAYITDYGSNSVSVISTATNTVTATIVGLNEPDSLAIAPNGYLYVTNFGNNSVSVINTATNAETANVPVGDYPVS